MPLVSQTFDQIINFTRATTGTFVGSNGLIQSAAIDAPRFDFDPVTLAPLGLLIEEQRTNLLLYSAEFDNVAWVKGNGTVTANTIASPDGTTNADAFIENTAASAFHFINEAVTKAASSIVYTASFYVKNKGRQVVVNLQSAGAGVSGRIDPATGTVVAAPGTFGTGWTAGTLTMTDAGNGWYRVVLTATSDTATNLTFQLALHNGTSTVYTGDGVSGVYLWGAQVEAAAFATSYIPTATAQATRAADIASITGANFSSWYNQSEGTIVVSADSVRSGLSPATRTFQFDDGTTANNIRAAGSSTLQVIDATVVVVNIAATPSIPFDGTVFTFASAYKLNDFATVTTGAVATDTSGTIPTVTRLALGGDTTAGNLCGHIRSIRYYPVRLSDAQLQALTS